MTIKPQRLIPERTEEEKRIRYLRREQQEREARESLKDFIKHQRDEAAEQEYLDYHWDNR